MGWVELFVLLVKRSKMKAARAFNQLDLFIHSSGLCRPTRTKHSSG